MSDTRVQRATAASQALRSARALYPPDPIPKVIPGGGVSLLAGSSGTGKTAFLAWFTCQMRDGLPIFHHAVPAAPAQAVLAIDRSWVQSTSQWFELAGYPDIPAYSPLDDPSFKASSLRHKGNRMGLLESFIDKLEVNHGPLPPDAILYVDPLACFLGGNLIDYDACAMACMQIREIARDRRLTIIGTAHTAKLKADKKDRYQRVQDRILGSTALLGYTDTQMYLASPEESDSRFYTFFWNPHHAKSETFDLTRCDKTGLFNAASATPHPDTPPLASHEPPSDHESLILDLLTQLQPQYPNAGVPYAAILEASGLKDGSVHRYLMHGAKEGRILKVGRGTYKRAEVS